MFEDEHALEPSTTVHLYDCLMGLNSYVDCQQTILAPETQKQYHTIKSLKFIKQNWMGIMMTGGTVGLIHHEQHIIWILSKETSYHMKYMCLLHKAKNSVTTFQRGG